MVSSMRDDATGKKPDGWTGQRFSDIYLIEGQKKKVSAKKAKKPMRMTKWYGVI